MTRAVILLAALAIALQSANQDVPRTRNAAEGSEGYRLEIASFASTRAYAVGIQSIVLVGTVVNRGQGALPSDTVTLRMHAVNGLDYLEGTTIIRLPAMSPGASTTYRWKVQPIAPDAPLIAALTLERSGCLPEVRVLPIQHFSSPPAAFGTPAPPRPAPAALATGTTGWVDNGKVRARVVGTNSDTAALFLWAKANGTWRQTGLAMPLIELLSGEPAQEPWWEGFKVRRCSAAVTPTQATLTVSGQVGMRWRGSVVLGVRKDSSVVDVTATLTSRRTMLLHGVRTCRLHVGEGSFGSSASEVLDPTPVGSALTAAVRWGSLTTGMTYPAVGLLRDWLVAPAATPDGADYMLVGAEYRANATPVEVQPEGAIRLRWRLYTLSPSSSVRDALKVSLPR